MTAMQSIELAPALVQYDFPIELAVETLACAFAESNWRPSTLVDDISVQPIRTSTDITLWQLPQVHNKITSFAQACVADYNDRFQCGITKLEPMSLLRYGPGGHYVSHADSCWQVYRVTSMLIYLNPDQYVGGETLFHLFGLKVKPDRPALVLFPANYAYEHEAMPVIEGEKVVVVTWMSDLPDGLDQETMRRVADGR